MTIGIGCGNEEDNVLDFNDIRRTDFHADATRDVYVELPEEDYEEGVCGQLNISLHGARDAAQNWEAAYTELMNSIGFETGKALPCKLLSQTKRHQSSSAWR